MQFWLFGVDTQTHLAAGRPAAGFTPGGAQGRILEEPAEKRLAVMPHVFSEGLRIEAAETLLAIQVDFDRKVKTVRSLVTLQDTDFQLDIIAHFVALCS